MNDLAKRIAALSPEKRALLLKQLDQAAGKSARPSIPRQPRETNAFPLSFAQQRLWLLEQLEPGTPAYNVGGVIRLTGRLNVAALAQSLNEIARRHEILRTTFAVREKPMQVVVPVANIDLPLVDLRSLPPDAREAEAMRLAIAEAWLPFDLEGGPLLRVRLLTLADNDHWLLATIHHIVSDGWSLGIFIREIASLYRASSAGGTPLPELPIQYADFSVWQREQLAGETFERQLAYWKRQLAGAPALLELPTDRPRPAVKTFRGANHPLRLSPALTESLKALAEQEGATLFMALLAAFQALLHRYTGGDDIVVGSPISNRTRPETEGLIGFFVNTLVLRGDLSGRPSFRELLRRVREVCLSAYAHQDLPFETLVEALQPDRDLSYTPLFQVLFVLQNVHNAPSATLELGDLRLELLDFHNGIVRHDITLSIVEADRGLRGDWQYNTDLFDPGTMARMAGHFQTLLESIAAEPDRPLAYLPILPEAECRMLVEWNATAADYPDTLCFHDLIEGQAEQTPDVVALVFAGEHLTYRALDRRANQLAHHLMRLGVGPEVCAGLCVERSLEMLVGLLGILKVGGAYVPLDPTYPQERLSFMLEDARLPVLLTQAQLLPELRRNLAGHDTRFVCLDADWPAIALNEDTRPISGVAPDNLAYIIYTSGSTGKPKGTLLRHRGMCNLARAELDTLGVGVGSRVLQFASLSFDSSVWEIVMTLPNGATFCLADREMLFSPDGLVQFLRDESITLAKMPPSVLATLPDADLPALRTLIVAGQSCPASLVERWSAGRTFINAYGPTEITVCATLAVCDAGYSQNPPIGCPLPNLQVYVLDRHLQPVPIGVPGEMYLGAVGLARGYLNRPDLTAERFVPPPSFPPPSKTGVGGGQRLYRTGDLARFLPDGRIDFLGRIDHQVKIRGFRIELGEIEAALSQHPSVRDVAVVAREVDIALGGKRLVAYIVPHLDRAASLTAGELRSHLQASLPDYMLPSAFVVLDALPLTPHGKVDRNALPPPDVGRLEPGDAFVAPRTSIEIALARIWAEALGVERVGVRDNFFELGGDSVLTIQIVSRARQAGLWLTPRQLFQHQTIAELAEAVGAAHAVRADQNLVTGSLPLTPIQRRFFEQDLPQPHHWNQAVFIEARQALNPASLEQAVYALLTHHDALRLRFTRNETAWIAFNSGDAGSASFACVDLSPLPELAQVSAIVAIAADVQTSLNLSAGPLLRAVWFARGAKAAGRLLIVAHHLIVDGVSWRILLEDLQTAYQQIDRGDAVAFPPKTTSFKRWAERLVAHARSETLKAELPYWLGDARSHIARLPVDFSPVVDANLEAFARAFSVSLDAEETHALLHEVPAAYHTQINDALLTALAQAFAEWTGDRTLLIDLESQGREDIFENVDLSRTVGWFTAVFPVALKLDAPDRPGEALKSIKEQLRRIPQNGIGYGIWRYLSDEASIVDRLRASPQAEVSFNYLGQFDRAGAALSMFRLTRDDVGPARSPHGARSHALAINALVVEGRLQVDWFYSERLHRRSTIESLARAYLESLRAIIAHCLSPDAGGYTPSDFADFQWSQTDLDEIAQGIGKALGEA